jgi:hypothetical protein
LHNRVQFFSKKENSHFYKYNLPVLKRPDAFMQLFFFSDMAHEGQIELKPQKGGLHD